MSIVINIKKVKLIAHDIRRAKRDDEFAPYDAVIAKQIPGADFAAAEAARQIIRDKYATMQNEIDKSISPDEIKVVLGLK